MAGKGETVRLAKTAVTHFTTPALATLTKGTSLPSRSFVELETRKRGTSRVSDTAISTEVNVAAA